MPVSLFCMFGNLLVHFIVAYQVYYCIYLLAKFMFIFFCPISFDLFFLPLASTFLIFFYILRFPFVAARRCVGRGRQRDASTAGLGRAGRGDRKARHLPILMRSGIPLSLVSLELYIIAEWELHRWISFVQPIKSSFRRYQTCCRHLSRRR